MKNNQQTVIPRALKGWFIFHFIVDISFALPLFFIPNTFLGLLGWSNIDPVTARLSAAALFGIGGESLLNVKLGKDAFLTMLNLKIIWSIAAILGFIIALIEGSFVYTFVGIGLVVIFSVFNVIWIYWRVRLNSRG